MSLIATRLQNWRIQNPELDRNMTRPCEYGALDFFIQQTDAPNSIISPNLRDRAFASMGNTVQVPVINYDGDVTVSNTRSCVIADAENTSALYTVVWKTYSVGFTMVPTLYMNNEISYDHDFARKMEKICRALATALDVDAVAALESQKTQVFKDLLQYQATSNVINVPKQMATEILGDINPIMRANCYPETIHIIGNAGVDSLIRKLAEHGIYNDVNKRMEYDNKIIHYTNNVVNAEGKNGTFFAVVDGNVGVLTRVDREALRRASANFHEWDVVRLPYIDLPVGSHYYTAVGDQSGIAGAASADMTCNVKEYFGFSVDVAYIVAYNSAPETVANPIIKAAIDAPNTNQPYATPVYITNASDFNSGSDEPEPEPTPTPSVTLDKETLSLVVSGETGSLTATTVPDDAEVDWTSSDETVATVANGVVTPLTAGTATITAKITVDGQEYSDTCVVTVTSE